MKKLGWISLKNPFALWIAFPRFLVSINIVRLQEIAGSTFPVEVNSTGVTLHGQHALLSVIRDITKRKKAKNRLNRLTECFLSFSIDPIANINRMTALCGELLGATCALYNCMEGDMLCSLGVWNTPPDYVSEDKRVGHICYDVIYNGGDDLVKREGRDKSRLLIFCASFEQDKHKNRINLTTWKNQFILFSPLPACWTLSRLHP